MKVAFLAGCVWLSFLSDCVEARGDNEEDRILRQKSLPYVDRVKGTTVGGVTRKSYRDEEAFIRPTSHHRFLKKHKVKSEQKKKKKVKPTKGRSRKKSADKLTKSPSSGKKSKKHNDCVDLFPDPILEIFQQVTAFSSTLGGIETAIPTTMPPSGSGKKGNGSKRNDDLDQMCCLASGLRGTLGFDWSDLMTGFSASDGVCPSVWNAEDFNPDTMALPPVFDTAISSMMDNGALHIMNEMIVEMLPLTQLEFYSVLDELISLISDELEAATSVSDVIPENNDVQSLEPLLDVLMCWLDPTTVENMHPLCDLLLQLPGIAFIFAVTPFVLPACDCHYSQELECSPQLCQETDWSVGNEEILDPTPYEDVNSNTKNESLSNNDEDGNPTSFLDSGYEEWNNNSSPTTGPVQEDYEEWSNDGNGDNGGGNTTNNNTTKVYEDWSNDSTVFRSHLDDGTRRNTKSLQDGKMGPSSTRKTLVSANEGLQYMAGEIFGLLMTCSSQQETCHGYCALHSNPSISVTEVCSIVENLFD